jgi:hypothetical protein
VATSFDSHNWVGSFVRETGPRDYPLSAPTAVAVIGGKIREFGPGEPVKVWSTTHFLVSIPVDEHNKPSGAEFATGSFLRVYRGTSLSDIGRWELVGSSAPNNLILSHDRQVAYWKEGKFAKVWTLPAKWRAVAANAKGEVLLRLAEGPRNEPATYDEAVRRDDSEDVSEELDWSAAILSNGKIRQIKCNRPRGAESLMWRDTNRFTSDGRVRFSAFYGDITKHYELKPKP